MVCDAGPEFTSTEFSEWCEAHDSRLHTIPVEAPWQNGIAERGGGTFKMRLKAVCVDHAVADHSSLKGAISAATQAHNMDINESGYSPW